jgi:hypothetical protein
MAATNTSAHNGHRDAASPVHGAQQWAVDPLPVATCCSAPREYGGCEARRAGRWDEELGGCIGQTKSIHSYRQRAMWFSWAVKEFLLLCRQRALWIEIIQ